MPTPIHWRGPFGTAAAPTMNPLMALGLVVGLLLGTGCNRDQVTRSTAPTPPSAAPTGAPAPMPMPGGAPAGMGSGMSGEVAPPPAPANALKWTLPKGWTGTPGSGMRFATLVPGGGGKAEVSVVCLPGAAGGELANVNRWRGQIGLGPLDEKALAASRQQVKCKAGQVAVFDFTSEGGTQTRMITGSLVTQDGNSWFFKLLGDAPAVGKARPDFLRLMETLHLD